MGLSLRVARLGKNEKRGANLRKAVFNRRSKHALSHRQGVYTTFHRLEGIFQRRFRL
jgi:hypothetical protein